MTRSVVISTMDRNSILNCRDVKYYCFTLLQFYISKNLWYCRRTSTNIYYFVGFLKAGFSSTIFGPLLLSIFRLKVLSSVCRPKNIAYLKWYLDYRMHKMNFTKVVLIYLLDQAYVCQDSFVVEQPFCSRNLWIPLLLQASPTEVSLLEHLRYHFQLYFRDIYNWAEKYV